MNVLALTDKTTLQTFLETNRVYHAYALADLADPFFQQCRWFATQSKAAIQTLVLLFRGLHPPALLSMGQAAYLGDLLANIPLPPQIMTLALEDHLPYLTALYKFIYLDPMIRMALPGAHFIPRPTPNVVPLNMTHLDTLKILYQGVHGNAFEAYQLESGVFYGIFKDSHLVSVAGTHIVSREYGIAAVGNIYTDPAHRGCGYAQQTTTAVCRDLLAQNLDVVLNVEQNNASAIRVYHKLGFNDHCLFWEGVGTIKR